MNHSPTPPPLELVNIRQEWDEITWLSASSPHLLVPPHTQQGVVQVLERLQAVQGAIFSFVPAALAAPAPGLPVPSMSIRSSVTSPSFRGSRSSVVSAACCSIQCLFLIEKQYHLRSSTYPRNTYIEVSGDGGKRDLCVIYSRWIQIIGPTPHPHLCTHSDDLVAAPSWGQRGFNRVVYW